MNHRGTRVFFGLLVALRVIIRPRPTLRHSVPKNGVARSAQQLSNSLPEAPELPMLGFRRRGRVSRNFSLADVCRIRAIYAGRIAFRILIWVDCDENLLLRNEDPKGARLLGIPIQSQSRIFRLRQ
jgi:hypothetical protein